MYLDPALMRMLGKAELRVLRAIELGMRNHEIVPIHLIIMIAKQKHGGTRKVLGVLHRHKLIHHENIQYDGYRLTYMGYDYLAIHTLASRGSISAFGNKIGVGKESDIFQVITEDKEILVLKLHRLGRTSFRAVKNKRDYLKHRTNFNWLYLSRLAAIGEYSFMKALSKRGFPVPKAIDQNRHAVLMSVVDAYPLNQISHIENTDEVFSDILYWFSQLAEFGLIHCDFNEYNIMVSKNENITLIDFPQMISVFHDNAEELFNRDLDCILTYFKRKYNFCPDDNVPLPDFNSIVETLKENNSKLEDRKKELDVELSASGFNNRYRNIMEKHVVNDEIDLDDISAEEEISDVSSDEEEEESEKESVTSSYDFSSVLSKEEQLELKKYQVRQRVSKQMKKQANTKVKLEIRRNVNKERSHKKKTNFNAKDHV